MLALQVQLHQAPLMNSPNYTLLAAALNILPRLIVLVALSLLAGGALTPPPKPDDWMPGVGCAGGGGGLGDVDDGLGGTGARFGDEAFRGGRLPGWSVAGAGIAADELLRLLRG